MKIIFLLSCLMGIHSFQLLQHPLENKIAYISGFRNTKEINDVTFNALRVYFNKYPLLIFKGFENVSPDDFLHFVKRFDHDCDNDVINHPNDHESKILQPFDKFPDCPHVAPRGNVELSNYYNIKNINIQPHDAFINNYVWHTDILGYETKVPNVVTGFYIIENPLIGGDTDFISGERVYENLSEEEKKAAQNILVEINRKKFIKAQAVTDYSGANRIEKFIENDERNVRIPILYAPDGINEKPHILLMPSFFEKVVGWNVDDSRKWMKKFMNEKVLPYRVSVQWKKNDLAVFNNRLFMHSSTPARNYIDNKDSSKRLLFQTFIPTKRRLLSIKPNDINVYSAYNSKWIENQESSKLSTQLYMKYYNAMLGSYDHENMIDDSYYIVSDHVNKDTNLY